MRLTICLNKRHSPSAHPIPCSHVPLVVAGSERPTDPRWCSVVSTQSVRLSATHIILSSDHCPPTQQCFRQSVGTPFSYLTGPCDKASLGRTLLLASVGAARWIPRPIGSSNLSRTIPTPHHPHCSPNSQRPKPPSVVFPPERPLGGLVLWEKASQRLLGVGKRVWRRLWLLQMDGSVAEGEPERPPSPKSPQAP